MICANVLNTRLIFVLRHARLRAHAHLAKCFSQNHIYSEQLYGPYCSIPRSCRILGDSVLCGFLRFQENCRQYGNFPEPSWPDTAVRTVGASFTMKICYPGLPPVNQIVRRANLARSQERQKLRVCIPCVGTAFLSFSAFCERLKFCNLRIFNTPVYSDSRRLHY